MRLHQYFVVAALAALMVTAGEWVRPAFASLGGDWTSSFEGTPADSENIALGAARIRTTRAETRIRGDVEHDWGTITGGNSDTGLHREGSAVAFFADAEPSALGDPAGTSLGSTTDGRVWVDSDNGNRLHAYDASATAFETVTALPTNAIILWAESQGDENCDGSLDDDECPCGFTEDTTFANLTIRGADTSGGTGNVPDSPGIVCDEEFGGGEGSECDASASGAYDDVIDEGELASHSHALTDTDGSSGGAGDFLLHAASSQGNSTNPTVATGSDDPHLHPFQTVLFCKANS